MTVKNKITGYDVTAEYLGLMEGFINNAEFELLTMTTPTHEPLEYSFPLLDEYDWDSDVNQECTEWDDYHAQYDQ